MDASEQVNDLARGARRAARQLRGCDTAAKNRGLRAIAAALRAGAAAICQANSADVEREAAAGMSAGLLDRLRLDPSRVEAIAGAVEDVVDLPDPVGQVVAGHRTPTGLRVSQVRVPLGVVAMIYEARPNVTVDATVLALKAGNAVLLRGGSAARETNAALVALMRQALADAGLPAAAVQSVDAWGRAGAQALMRARGLVDVLIPRGGAGLIRACVEGALVPVIETGTGNCHVYVDASANLRHAVNIVMNAKTQRVGVCNAAETLLIHADVAAALWRELGPRMHQAGVTCHMSEVARDATGETDCVLATAADWAREYLSLDLAVEVVPDLDSALNHIECYSSGHTEAIVADDVVAVEAFKEGVDAAAIAVNASTRFTDGGELGLGAEIGISTQKLHARGPMGLQALTSTTWLIEGAGHVRA